MKLNIDTDSQTLITEQQGQISELPLYGKEAFEIISSIWMKTSWNQKYPYTFTWLGRPLIQHPEDAIRVQEVLYNLQPDVIVETGVAHGGSLIFYASLCKAANKGRVIGVDIEIRAKNRASIEAHSLFPYITLIEGNSVCSKTVNQVENLIKPGEKVVLILDSNHSKEHVGAELRNYQHLVSVGSYIIATDGLMEELHDVPNGKPEWEHNNPAAAAREFAQENSDFIIEEPGWNFNESNLDKNITGWPSAWLKRIR